MHYGESSCTGLHTYILYKAQTVKSLYLTLQTQLSAVYYVLVLLLVSPVLVTLDYLSQRRDVTPERTRLEVIKDDHRAEKTC